MMKKNNTTSTESEKEHNKGNLVNILVLLVGVISLILLSMNFISNYKFVSITNPISYREPIQEIKNNDPPKLEIEASSTSGTTEEKINVVTKIEDKCYNYLTFLQEIYNLRPLIEKGDNYSHIMTSITQYSLSNNIIQDNLDILSSNASLNMPKDYYLDQLRNSIKSLYKEANQSDYKIANFLSNLFFIRAIGERAIAKGGIDMAIYESEQALIKHDFTKALKHLNDINSKIQDFNQLKEQIAARVNMENAFQQIEKLLLEKVDCSIVSK